MIHLTKDLLTTYNVEGPRYTSYPTAPVWNSEFTEQDYRTILEEQKYNNEPLSLYIHIPFCQKRCFYCACNVVVRKQHDDVGDVYLSYLEKELSLLVEASQTRPIIKQIHIGGGTPTFLTDAQLSRLDALLAMYLDVSNVQEKSIEIDSRTMDCDRIQHLYHLKFTRLSFGFQDSDPDVQKEIGRLQSVDHIIALINEARQYEFSSINCDLIYGLPGQTLDRFRRTLETLISIKPDRIALYSFAYVPWLHPHQNAMNAELFPGLDEKLNLFLYARETLLSSGYDAIAMDHFALHTDELSEAYREGRLYRTFMGYTTLATSKYIGIGVSSIGDMGAAFIQNTKDLKTYYELLDQDLLPVEKGYLLSERDKKIQWIITTLMCQFTLKKSAYEHHFGESFDAFIQDKLSLLRQCEQNQLLSYTSESIIVTELGKLFIRNICMIFDDYLPNKSNSLSKTI